jgi:hypothetical protein
VRHAIEGVFKLGNSLIAVTAFISISLFYGGAPNGKSVNGSGVVEEDHVAGERIHIEPSLALGVKPEFTCCLPIAIIDINEPRIARIPFTPVACSIELKFHIGHDAVTLLEFAAS